MQRVFVLSSSKRPLMPCQPARARELLRKGRAAVFRAEPFTIVLLERETGDVQDTELKVDPGSKKTGVVLAAACRNGAKVVFAAEIEHRGSAVKKALDQRRSVRRQRRNRHVRHRSPRFDNRKRVPGWLPPSLMSRVHNVQTWGQRLKRLAPLSSVAVETVRFDLQVLERPDIQGIEYQQGTLAGYETREYLLEKFARTCIYCDKQNVPLQIEHIVPRAKGGSSRVANLGLACQPCNKRKGSLDLHIFLKGDGGRLKRITAQLKRPLRDAAAVNATRHAVGRALQALNLPTTFWSGGRTKHNRIKQGYPKTHWHDAACVGMSGASVFVAKSLVHLDIKAMGHGDRQACLVDKYGFPRSKPSCGGGAKGFRTGDLVKAVVKSGKQVGTHRGRVAVRTSGHFNIKTVAATVQGIRHLNCQKIMGCDGYAYSRPERAFLPDLKGRVSCAETR